jgi:hypothetical protein
LISPTAGREDWLWWYVLNESGWFGRWHRLSHISAKDANNQPRV